MKWVITLLCLFLVACSGVAFEAPDIKDDFCGVHIDFKYCKCAFHNSYCGTINMERSVAQAYVNAQYALWVDGLFDDFVVACGMNSGFIEERTCYTCDEGYVLDGDECVAVEEVQVAFVPDGPLDENCKIIQDEFATDWRKYSDIDAVIPYEERSYEAKKTVDVYDEMIDKMIQAFALERDIEIENQMQEELITYQDALVKDLKTNLLKSFWRLSWITYSTVKSGTGLGNSYSEVLNKGANVESVGAGLKVVQGMIPGSSSLAINTSTTFGKAKSVGANVALEVVDTLGDPIKVATELFKSVANAPLPSADISPEEIEILRVQHLESGLLNQVLDDSRKANAQRETELLQLDKEITELQADITRWEVKEKERVALMLEESCKDLKKARS